MCVCVCVRVPPIWRDGVNMPYLAMLTLCFAQRNDLPEVEEDVVVERATNTEGMAVMEGSNNIDAEVSLPDRNRAYIHVL